MSAYGLCGNPVQCAAYHELSGHLKDVSTKLTGIMSVLQLFFQSWKNTQLNHSPPLESSGEIHQASASPPESDQPTVYEPYEIRPDGQIVTPRMEGGPIKTEMNEAVLLLDEAGPSWSDPDFCTQDGDSPFPPGFPFNRPKRRYSDLEPRRKTARGEQLTPDQIKREICLFRGKVLTVHMLSRYGNLSTRRRWGDITNQQIRDQVLSLVQDGILVKIEGASGRPYKKAAPEEEEMESRLAKYDVTLDQYEKAFHAEPYAEKEAVNDLL